MNLAAPDRRARQKKEKREAITAAAVRVFFDNGVQSSTMDEIARTAGVSKGALYLYFESKEELFLSIALSAVSETVQRIERSLERDFENGRDQYRAILESHIAEAFAQPGRFQVAMSWLRDSYQVTDESPLFEAYRERMLRIQQLSFSAIERGQMDGSLVFVGSPREFGLQTFGAVFGLIMLQQNSSELSRRMDQTVSLEGLALRFLDRHLGAILAPPN